MEWITFKSPQNTEAECITHYIYYSYSLSNICRNQKILPNAQNSPPFPGGSLCDVNWKRVTGRRFQITTCWAGQILPPFFASIYFYSLLHDLESRRIAKHVRSVVCVRACVISFLFIVEDLTPLQCRLSLQSPRKATASLGLTTATVIPPLLGLI